jgi:hypothetical protein
MSGDGMEYGVAVLLDALGTKKNYKRESINDIRGRWNEIDDFFEHSVGTFSEKLHDKGYRYAILHQRPYDNFQIFVPADEPSTEGAVINLSGTTSIWWTFIELGELLIPLFRKALINRIFLTGCICAGNTSRVIEGFLVILLMKLLKIMKRQIG